MFYAFCGIVLILIFVWASRVQDSANRAAARLKNALATLPATERAFIHIGADLENALAIDPGGSALHILAARAQGVICYSIPSSQIINVELFEDGDTILSGSLSRTIGGAAIGGALFGGAGAVVGGLSGDKRASSVVRSIELRIAVNDMLTPAFVHKFQTVEHPKASREYAEHSRQAREWHARILVLLRRSEGDVSVSAIQKRLIADGASNSMPAHKPQSSPQGNVPQVEHRLDID